MDLQPQEDPTQVETINPVLLDSLFETHKRINKEVSKNIEKAQARQKKNYDHRHDVSCDIEVGDIVVIKKSKRIHRMRDIVKRRTCKFLQKFDVADNVICQACTRR